VVSAGQEVPAVAEGAASGSSSDTLGIESEAAAVEAAASPAESVVETGSESVNLAEVLPPPTEDANVESVELDLPQAEDAPTASASELGSPGAEPVAIETEVFYTFTWAPRARGGEGRTARSLRTDRLQARPQRPVTKTVMIADEVQAQPLATETATDAPAAQDRAERPERRNRDDRSAAKPRGGHDGKGKQGDRPGGNGRERGDGERGGKDRFDRGADRGAKPATFEARPPGSDKVDPDNPFAVLAALRNRT